MLTPLVVVVINKLSYCIHKRFIGFKMVEIIHFTLQDAPETLHRTIVNASANTGHTLPHTLLFQPILELLARVLKSPVTVK